MDVRLDDDDRREKMLGKKDHMLIGDLVGFREYRRWVRLGVITV